MVRRLARLLLGGAFINSGVEALRDMDRRASKASDYRIPEPVTTLRAIGALQVGAGGLLAMNRLPRFAALIIGLTVVPEAATGHGFWTEKDSDAKRSQRSLFMRDVGLLGGLLVTAIDNGGRESVPHRMGRTARRATKAANPL